MLTRLKITIPAILLTTSSIMLVGCDRPADSTAKATNPDTKVEAREASNVTTEKIVDVDAKPDAKPNSPDKPVMNELTATKIEGGLEPGPQRFDKPVVVAEPASLDLGEIPTNDSKTGVIRLVNTADERMRVLNCKSSCGCTAAKCPKGEWIAPGESAEIEIRMKGGARPTTIKKKVTFTIDGQPPLVVDVQGKAVSYVEMVPSQLSPETMPEGRVILRAIDETPFRITRMLPNVIAELPQEQKTEFVLNIDWAEWERLGSQRRVVFYTDHPKAPQVQSIVRVTNRVNDKVADAKNAKPDPKSASASASAPSGDVSTLAAKGNTNMPGGRSRADVADPAVLLDQKNTEAILKRLEEGTLSPEYTDRTNTSLLSLAAQKGDLAVVERLIDMGANVEAKDRVGRTPLMGAAQSKNAEIVRTLLDAGANIRARDQLGGTALSWAAGFGNADTVQVLIDNNAELEVAGAPIGYTPLIWASMVGEPESVTTLINAGADIEARDYAQGATPLMLASTTGRVDNVKALIDGGADLTKTNPEDKTAFIVAAGASGGNVETLKVLIEAGADPTAVDVRGLNALDHANKRTDPRSPAVIEYLSTLMSPTVEPDSDSTPE